MRARLNRWLVATGEWAVLLPVWRRFIRPRGGRVGAVIATAAVWLVILAVAAGAGGGDGKSDGNDRQAEARASATPKRTARPARTRPPSPLPSPSPSLSGTAQPTAAPGITDATPVPSAGNPGNPAPPGAPTLAVISSSSYTDSNGDLHVAGQVRNDGADYLEFVEITGAFFDAGGQAVASDYTYTHADFVAPGETAGFDLLIPGGGSLGVSRYELSTVGEVTADRPAAGLVIQGDSSNVDDVGDYHVLGMVVNQGATPAEFVKVIGTFYAADGTVVRSDFTYTDLDVVPAGGTDSFDLVIPEGGSAAIATYQLKVEGFPV